MMASIRQLFNRWVFAGSLLFGCFLVFIFGIGILLMRPAQEEPEALPALVQKIPASTATLSTQQPGFDSEGQALADGINPVPDSALPAPGEISIGTYVKISGTGGDGLRLRDVPGLAGNVMTLGEETEVFLVDNGPRDVDGYTWWYLKGHYDETRQGCGVVDYLLIVENP
jgi:hypothetical protein